MLDLEVKINERAHEELEKMDLEDKTLVVYFCGG